MAALAISACGTAGGGALDRYGTESNVGRLGLPHRLSVALTASGLGSGCRGIGAAGQLPSTCDRKFALSADADGAAGACAALVELPEAVAAWYNLGQG